MVALLVISIILIVTSIVGAFVNFGNQANKMFSGDVDKAFGSFGGTFKRHAMFAALSAIGTLGALVSGITLIVRALAH